MCSSLAHLPPIHNLYPPPLPPQGPLYGIVNNAGIAGGELADIFNTNVQGPRRVDAAFLPILDKAAGRIVQISSGAASQCVQKCSAERAAFFGDDAQPHPWTAIARYLTEAQSYGVANFEANGIGAALGGYGLSKALLNCYTAHMAAKHSNLTINACSPGMIQTDIINQMVPWYLPIPSFAMGLLARNFLGALTPDQGTVAPMKLLFGELEGSGHYYGSDGLRSPLDAYRKPGSPEYKGAKL
jgi:carbonyl reductase 1